MRAGSRRRAPLDPRLLRRSRAVRSFVLLVAALGAVSSAALVLQAVVVGQAVSASLHHHVAVGTLAWDLAAVAALATLRAFLAWAGNVAAHRTSSRVKSALRADLAGSLLTLGPVGQARLPTGEVATLAVRGLDALDPYFGRYLPQLLLAAFAPLGMVAWVASFDWVSAASIAAAAALVPVFGVLLGLAARRRAEAQWRQVAGFGGRFLDVVQGLTTLRALGRAEAQATGIERASDALRSRTVSTLRIAFLSALALELLASLGTALVAVTLAVRLLHGSTSLAPALAVLMVAPEVFVPLRRASAEFHSSAEGLAALDSVFDLVDRAAACLAPAAGESPLQAPARTGLPPGIRFEGVTLRYPGRTRPALESVHLEVAPGERVLVTGPSGAGKSSLLNLLLRFAEPSEGRVLAWGKDLVSIDPRSWREALAWVPQRPHLFAVSVADNIALGTARDMARIRAAAEAAGALEFIERLPDGFETVLGENGQRLSGGERQRIALARAFTRDAALVLLDEPTANLDDGSEGLVREAVGRLMEGRTVLVASHRPAWRSDVDRVVEVRAGKVPACVRVDEAAAPALARTG